MQSVLRARTQRSRLDEFEFEFSPVALNNLNIIRVGRDSAVGIATRYRLDGPVIEYRGERHFPQPSRPALGSAQPPIQWVPGISWG